MHCVANAARSCEQNGVRGPVRLILFYLRVIVAGRHRAECGVDTFDFREHQRTINRDNRRRYSFEQRIIDAQDVLPIANTRPAAVNMCGLQRCENTPSKWLHDSSQVNSTERMHKSEPY